MAWITQQFTKSGFRMELTEQDVSFDDRTICLTPQRQEDAHAWAMMLRKAARRLEEIGRGLK